MKPKRLLLLVSFVLVVVLTAAYAVHTVRRACYLCKHKDEPIRAWMSIGYISRSYHVPPPFLYQAVGLPAQPPDRRPLRAIAHTQKRQVKELVTSLEFVILQVRQQQESPPP